MKHLHDTKFWVTMYLMPYDIFVKLMNTMRLACCYYLTGQNGGRKWAQRFKSLGPVPLSCIKKSIFSLKEILLSYSHMAEILLCKVSSIKARALIEKEWNLKDCNWDKWADPDKAGDDVAETHGNGKLVMLYLGKQKMKTILNSRTTQPLALINKRLI